MSTTCASGGWVAAGGCYQVIFYFIWVVVFESDGVSLTLAWCGKTCHGGGLSSRAAPVRAFVVRAIANPKPRASRLRSPMVYIPFPAATFRSFISIFFLQTFFCFK